MLGWMIIIGSVFVVVNVFETLTGLRSLETREMVEDYLATAPGSELGWSVETGIGALRITSMVAAMSAAAAAVLGWFVLQRNVAARVVLSVLAVPLFFAGVVTGGFMSSLVAASVALLWMQPARNWFNGIAPPKPQPLGRDDSGARNPFARPEEGPRTPEVTGTPDRPTDARPVDGFGDRPTWGAPLGGPEQPPVPVGQPEGPPSPYGHQPGTPYGAPTVAPPQPYAPAPQAQLGQQSGQQPVGKRPPAAVWAALITWLFAGFALLSSAFAAIALAVDPDQMDAQIDQVLKDVEGQQGAEAITSDMLIGTMITFGVGLAIFSLVACLAAALLLARRKQGAIILMITAAFTAAFCLLGGLAAGQVLLLPPGLAAVVVLVLLRRRELRAWLDAR